MTEPTPTNPWGAKKQFGDEGLHQEWTGNVVLDPPRPVAWGKWGPKALREWKSGRVTAMTVVIHDYEVRHPGLVALLPAATAYCESRPSPGHWRVLLYYGPDHEKFIAKFAELGDTRIGGYTVTPDA